MIPCLLKLVAMSATKFWSGNSKHFIEVEIDARTSIEMKTILQTEQMQCDNF